MFKFLHNILLILVILSTWLSKISDFNHLKIKFAQKTQKSKNKSKKISKGKNQRNM
jgi:hypothetical protein